ncbi:MAG: SCO6880 family protein, partial [Actinomycetes bacterium]
MHGEGVGVIHDRQRRCASASLPVSGREFSLVEQPEQERLLALWGDVLGGFCHERSAGVAVRVTEWATPSGVDDHERFLATRDRRRANRAALASYRELLAEAGAVAVGHEVLVTVTVDYRRARRAAGSTGGRTQAAVDTLFEEMRLVAQRLEAAGLAVGPPLAPRQSAEVLASRLDPGAATRRRAGTASLAELVGLAQPGSTMASVGALEWRHVRVGDCVHRSYWVAEWPRLECGSAWLEPLVLHAGGTRTLSILYEPVTPSRAERRIDRDSTRLAADEEQRSRAGFRIGARHRRIQASVAEREAELVAGYAEMDFAGLLTVSGPDAVALAKACAGYEQAAAQAGIALLALDGRHDLGLACALPL